MTQAEMDYLIQGISDAINGSNRGGGGASYRPRSGRVSDDDLNGFSKITKMLEEAVGQVGAIYNEVKKLTDPWAKADHAASKYVKTVGMAKKGMEDLRRDTLKNITNNGLTHKYNIDPTELLEAQTNYVKGIGRNIRISEMDQENMAAMRAVAGNIGTELAGKFENFGLTMSDTADHVGKMFTDASKEGVLFEAYAENVSKNIKIAQNYTFKNGIKGLESMAKKATALKLDMQQVAAFADKVSTVEGAIDVSAKLQVLGGPFAAMADPLGMLNEGLNDMEGLQDRLVKMVGGMGSFDKSTGEVKVSAFNKARIKEAANAMGVSYDSIMESVNAQAKRGEIDKQISASSTASALPDEMKELIRNSGTFKDGKAGVSIRGEFKSLDELSGKDYEALKKETQTESEDIKDIAANLRSLVDAREGLEKSYETWMARIYSWLGQTEKWILKGIAHLTIIGAIVKGVFAAGRIGELIQGFKGIFSQGMGGSGNRMGGFGNRIGGLGKNLLGGVGNKILGKTATSTIVKGGLKRTATRAIAKIGGKAAAKGAATLGGKLATGLAKGGPWGLVAEGISLAGNALMDRAIAKGKMKKGGVGHHVGKAATGALSGAAIGSILGPVGAAVGAVIGGAVGLVKAGKAKQERKLEEKLSGTGITVQGKYNRRKLKKINKALETGEISDRMRRKLEKQGDTELLAQIDKVKAEKKEKAKERVSKLKEKLGISKKKFGTANFTVGVANFNGRGLNGLLGNKQNVIGGAISIGTKIKEKGGTIIKAVKEKGLSGAWEAIKEKKEPKKETQTQTVPKSFDININGSLKLTGDNGQSVDIIGELRKNPQMLRSLADMIAKEISYLEKGTTVVQKG